MKHRQGGVGAADVPDQSGCVAAGARSVENQELDIRQFLAQLASRPTVVGLEDAVATHTQEAGDGEQQGIVVANDDAASLY